MELGLMGPTLKISEIKEHPTMRLDAKYWIQKALLKKKKKELEKKKKHSLGN